MALLTNMTLPLGKASAKAPTSGASDHVEQREDRHQCRALPFGRAADFDQFHGGNEKRVVGQ